MEAGYRIETQPIGILDKAILVSNYDSLNLVYNLPCMAESAVLVKDSTNVGFWKIKLLKKQGK